MKAVYPGSFDPISNGHLDVIKRASSIFEELHVLISTNVHKHPTFSVEERVAMISKVCKDLKNVKVVSTNELTVTYAKKNNINVIIRGLRNYTDYESEYQLAQFNKDIAPDIETLLLFPSTKTQFVSSSSIKELLAFNVDIRKYVPDTVADEILKKFKSENNLK
jgi:pantetheine-phosphate adenylyltransferase